MTAKLSAILLAALAFGQVLSEDVKLGYIEDFKLKVAAGDSRIVSGWTAAPGQHPHQLSLRCVNANGDVSGCGGSLVAREWGITAAHCTAQQAALVVRAGLNDLTRPAYISETREWYNHPRFDVTRPHVVQTNDIAILRLTPKVTYNEFMKPIAIQRSRDAFKNYNNEVVYASGFGRTWTGGSSPETLHWVYLRAQTNSLCAMTFGTELIIDSAVCAAGYNVTSQSTCQGDSGGPLVHEGPDGPTLIGVAWFVAGGDWGCHSGFPAAFIRPGPYLPWFKEVTTINFEELDETEEETTLAPTTTEEPTTEAPITEEPTTETPTTEEPTTETPTTEGPTTEVDTEEPSIEENAWTEKPEENNGEDSNESENNSNETENNSNETENNSNESENSKEDSDSSSSEENKDLAKLLKRLEVDVNVKVKMDKLKKKHNTNIVHEKRD